MADIHDIRPNPGGTPIGVLGGRERTIKFDLNAFAEIDRRFGNIEALMTQMEKGSFDAIKKILWAGLIHDEVVLDEFTGDVLECKITPYEVGGWVDMSNLGNISLVLAKSIRSELPQEAAEEMTKQIEAVTSNVAKVVLTEEEKQQELVKQKQETEIKNN